MVLDVRPELVEPPLLAVPVEPDRVEGHFVLAMALGRVALTKSKKDRVKYAVGIYEEATRALEIDPGQLELHGPWKAKLTQAVTRGLQPRGQLVLVSAITPTPAGEQLGIPPMASATEPVRRAASPLPGECLDETHPGYTCKSARRSRPCHAIG